MTLVVRATYLLVPGKPLALPEGPSLVAQGPMSAETYRDEDADRVGECLYPGDFADWKPHAEVMLRGTCHTPFGKPLSECPVRFSVGTFSKLLRIIGRRFWSDDNPGAVMSEAAPFTKMPVDYAHAFGGSDYGRTRSAAATRRSSCPTSSTPASSSRAGATSLGPPASARSTQPGRSALPG